MLKNGVVFLVACVLALGLAGTVFADTAPSSPGSSFGITIPNPLCLSGSSGCINDFPTLIKQITKYISGIVGSLAVIIFIWAGILFVTSAGNEAQLTKAKKALLYGVIGAGIALAGAGLVAVINAVLGVP